MVQVQCSWFSVIDRNPQTYVPNIAKAPAAAFVVSTQTGHRAAVVLLRERPQARRLRARA
jgi:hypothetical protein